LSQEVAPPEVSIATKLGNDSELNARVAGKALSHYQIERVTNLLARQTHAAVTTSRHVSMADALKARCVLAEVRWRWTLKVL
jgi:hypothetical protein